MMGYRRSVGRFGIGQRLASVAAIAVLAVSPAIASFADAQLDGVALALVEAVFGEPASAQECTDINGDPRECTASENNSRCLAAVEDATQQCADANPWYLEFLCAAAMMLDIAACTAQLIGDFIPIIGSAS